MPSQQAGDLLIWYPDYIDQMQTIISGMKEFSDLKKKKKAPSKRGDYYDYQIFISLYMRIYNFTILLWQPGVGKSCGAGAVGEGSIRGIDETGRVVNPLDQTQLRGVALYTSLKILNDPGNYITRVIFLVKGTDIEREMKNQLVCKCTYPGLYDTEEVNSPYIENYTQQSKALTRSLSGTWRFMTYGQFASKALLETDENLIKKYDGTLFVIDEAHIPLRFDEPPVGWEQLRAKRLAHLEEVSRMKSQALTPEDAKRIKVRQLNKEEVYMSLERVFILVERKKLMFMTGSPMVNSARELKSMVNLGLPLLKKFLPGIDISKLPIDELEKKLRGILSFVRGTESGAVIKYQGVPLPRLLQLSDGTTLPATTIVYPIQMGTLQTEGYRRALQTQEACELEETEVALACRGGERQASILVYPDGSSGSAGFNKYVVNNGVKYEFTPEMRAAVADPARLYEMSAVIFYSIKLTEESPPGVCYSYIPFVKGSGAIALVLCYEIYGYEIFVPEVSMFAVETGRKVNPICYEPAKTRREPRIQKRKRIALITSEGEVGSGGPVSPIVKSSKLGFLKEALLSPENKHGDYIRKIIVTPVGQTGINIFHAVTVELIAPHWTPAENLQALFRANRADAYNELAKEKSPVEVNIYLPSAYYVDNGQAISVHFDAYAIAEEKGRDIGKMFRKLERIAIDCPNNLARNMLPASKDGTVDCEYMTCEYSCYDPSAEGRFSYDNNYILLYSGKEIDNIVSIIRYLFRFNYVIDMEVLYKMATDRSINTRLVDEAVYRLIYNRDVIYDRFGHICYLHENQNKLFLDMDYPVDAVPLKSDIIYYDSTLNIIGKHGLNEYVSIILEPMQEEILRKLQTMDPAGTEEFRTNIESLTLDNQVKLLEYAIHARLTFSQTTPNLEHLDKFTQSILRYFSVYLNTYYKPTIEINKTLQKINTAKKYKEPKLYILNQITGEFNEPIQFDQTGEVVYFHSLYSKDRDKTAFGAMSRLKRGKGLIRLLVPSELVNGTSKGWRDVNTYEYPAYNALVQYFNFQKMPKGSIVGIYVKADNLFRIVDRTKEDVSKSVSNEKLARDKGVVCTTKSTEELIGVMYNIGIPIPENSYEDEQEMKDFLVSKLPKKSKLNVNALSIEEIEYYYVWYTRVEKKSGMQIKDLCGMIKQKLQETGHYREI